MCKIQYNFYSKMRLVGLIHTTLKIIINQPPLKSVLRRMRVVELRVAVASCELRVTKRQNKDICNPSQGKIIR